MLSHMVMLRTSFMAFMLAASSLPTISAVSCPSGDTAGVIKDGKTCVQLVSANNAECYVASFETTCCQSCNNVATSNPNCLYGDTSSCFEFLCPSYSDLSPCCATCASLISTASTVSTSASAAASSSSPASAAISSSTSASNKNESSSAGSNGGVIAGAVVGSIIGLSALAAGTIIALKFLKKKDNKIEGETKSTTVSVIPEKIDRHPSSIPERLYISTVLQEKLDTRSNNPEKLETLDDPKVLDTHGDSKEQIDTSDKLVASNGTKNVNSDEKECPGVNVERNNFVTHTKTADSEAYDDLHTVNSSTSNHTGSENNSGKRNFSLPTLIPSYSNVPPLHERLPPIVSSANESGKNVHNED